MSNRGRNKRNCNNCGKYYEGYGYKYCSAKCYVEWFNKNFIPKREKLKCENCSEMFHVEHKYKKQRFCSINCRVLFIKKNGSPKKIYPEKRGSANIRTRYYNIKRRCINRGWNYPSPKEFLRWWNSQIKICYYCGIPEEIWEQKYNGYQNKYSLSIDRKDNNKGYELSNVVLACGVCNVTKNNFFTAFEMKEIAEKYIKPKWHNIITENEKCLH